MPDEITNTVLLQHIQGLRSEMLVSKQDLYNEMMTLRQVFQSEMTTMKRDLQAQITSLDRKVDRLSDRVERGFEEARVHRQALQEDLDATIRMVGRHEVKLAKKY